MGNVLHYLLFGELPALDVYNRPKWAYGLRIHDLCERRGHFDAGELYMLLEMKEQNKVFVFIK